MAALVFLGMIAATAPPATLPGPGLTAEQAMANYRTKLDGAKPMAIGTCPAGSGGDIVVCGRDSRPSARLPMPEARAEPGEVVHHRGELGQDPGPPQMPSKLGETAGKLIGLLKGAVTGEDRGY